MAVGYYFAPKSMSADQYDETLRRLEQAGQGSPDGRIVHVAFSGESGLNVFDVWESAEKFDAFGQTLMPILGKIGIDVGQPDVVQVHNLIHG